MRERWRRTNGRHYTACSGKPHFQHSQQVPLSMPPCLEGLWLLLRASKIAACHAFLAVNCLEHHGKWITPTHLTLGLWKGVIWRDKSSPVRFAGSQESATRIVWAWLFINSSETSINSSINHENSPIFRYKVTDLGSLNASSPLKTIYFLGEKIIWKPYTLQKA